MATVTIILPVFNGEAYLREAIDSVLRQTYSDFELWVMNDGSTDGSMRIVDSYADPRIRRFDNNTNLGLVATLNRALDMVESPFVARIDDDDIWHPQKLELQINLLDSRPDVGICGTSIHKFGDVDSVCLFPEEADSLKVGLMFHCMMSHPSVVYRRGFLLQSGIRYRAEYFPAEDYKMWIEALQHTNIYNLQLPLVEYRQHGEQICRTENERQHVVERRLHEEQLRLIYPSPTTEELSFHLDHFLSLHPTSDADARRYLRWAEKLCQANSQSHYIAPRIMRQELMHYVYNALRAYYRANYHGAFHHFFSGRMLTLDARHNASLLLHR